MTKKPKVIYQRATGALTITIGPYGSFAGDFFLLLAKAAKEKAWELSGDCKEDAEYIEEIADAVLVAVEKANNKNQQEIANIFG